MDAVYSKPSQKFNYDVHAVRTTQLQLLKCAACILQICVYNKHYQQPQATRASMMLILWRSIHTLTTSSVHVSSRKNAFVLYSHCLHCTTLLLKEVFAGVTM